MKHGCKKLSVSKYHDGGNQKLIAAIGCLGRFIRMIKKSCLSWTFISVVCVIIMLEVGFRLMSTRLSSNVQHISEIPVVAVEISEARDDVDETVLVMGNSLIGNAVDINKLEKALSQASTKQFAAYKVVPDSTSLWDWNCITKHNFAASQDSPDTIIIGFAWGQLYNKKEIRPSRLAAYFCTVPDLLDLYQHGMRRSSDVLEYLVASTSRLYAMREVIQKRVLDLIIYGYRSNVRYMNAVVREVSHTSELDTQPENDYSLLLKYLEILSENNIRPIFVAMPVLKDYELKPEVIHLIEENGGVFFDMRYMAGISKDMFIDPIHLGAVGRNVFTMNLANVISVQHGKSKDVSR